MNARCPHCAAPLDIRDPDGSPLHCPACAGHPFSLATAQAGLRVCAHCATVAEPASGQLAGLGGLILELLLVITAAVLIFTAWPLGLTLGGAALLLGYARTRARGSHCPACAARALIPLDTPVGRRLSQTPPA